MTQELEFHHFSSSYLTVFEKMKTEDRFKGRVNAEDVWIKIEIFSWLCVR